MSLDYTLGQWAAFNRVLHLINTYDEKLVSKGRLFDDVMEMRPAPPAPSETADALTAERVWVIYPDDGGAAVLWLEPCPFPVDDGQVVEYRRADTEGRDG